MADKKQKILIVDDSEMNRDILAVMLGSDYEILEAENGLEAIEILQQGMTDIDLILLDIMMPEMDGFDVLGFMKRSHMTEVIPVIMISSESSSSYIEKAYEMGAADYISRPFNALIVGRRVINTLMLYAKQKRLVQMVADQVYEREKNNDMMVNILSHIVEFRNGESGQHVRHIHMMTEILLQHLQKRITKYQITQEDIVRIATASALHDIGKISIPDTILNKPGKLTKEEYEIVKTHSMAGAQMLDALPEYKDTPFVKTAYEICRWHHERYDGKGYPDGLNGEEIPISAQIVSVADVYDALTSERCYKKSFSHEKAMEMILNGECGQFSPLILECLQDSSQEIQENLCGNPTGKTSDKSLRTMTRQLTVAAQSLMMTYETLSLQKDTLTKQVEVYEKALNLEKTKQAAGMSTAADVLEKENQLLSARSSLSSLEESLNSTYSSLCLMVGRDTDSGLVICEIPAADLAKADSMDLEADTKKAIGNNSSLISSRGTKATSTAAKNNRNATVEEGEQNLTIQMNQLYENVLLKKSELQAAQTAFRKAEGQKKNADIKYSAGLLSQEEYLTEEMNYISQTASYKAADLAFTQAADTYGWAVMGITQ